jgi:thiamine-monophosphate kinase
MKEQKVLQWLSNSVPGVGDDCAVIPFRDTHLVFTTDMLWSETDFPEGISPYTIGWRTVAVSLSDIAAMGAVPLGVVVALGAPQFEEQFLKEVLSGGLDCCSAVNAQYVGGDLSKHSDLTLTSSALGESEKPVLRSGSNVGDLVCVTGELGRTAVALQLFDQAKTERANELFQFTPRIAEGLKLSQYATSMMDISDGLARSLHQLGKASSVGFTINYGQLPVVPEVTELSVLDVDMFKIALHTGEDFELLFTIPESSLQDALAESEFKVIGEVTEKEILIEIDESTSPLEDIGYEH